MTHASHSQDEFVVYRCPDDEGMFIAHSIRTDQQGIADSIEEAMCELFFALRAHYQAADDADTRGETFHLYRRAPERVRKLYFDSDELPQEVWDAAKLRVNERTHAPKSGKLPAATYRRDLGEQTLYGTIRVAEREQLQL